MSFGLRERLAACARSSIRHRLFREGHGITWISLGGGVVGKSEIAVTSGANWRGGGRGNNSGFIPSRRRFVPSVYRREWKRPARKVKCIPISWPVSSFSSLVYVIILIIRRRITGLSAAIADVLSSRPVVAATQFAVIRLCSLLVSQMKRTASKDDR